MNYYVMPGIKRDLMPITYTAPLEMVEGIVYTVCQHLKVNKELIYTKTRKREIVKARNIVLCIIRQETNQEMSLREIGAIFNRDHSTVTHAMKVMTRDKDLKRIQELFYPNLKIFLPIRVKENTLIR